MAVNSFSASRASKKLFAKAMVTMRSTTTALVNTTVEIAGLTALLSLLNLCSEVLFLVIFQYPARSFPTSGCPTHLSFETVEPQGSPPENAVALFFRQVLPTLHLK